MSQLPSINQLKAFEAAVRYGSVTAAAKHLSLTQAAVSKQISQLEESLGISLFLRSADGLALTDVGVEYYGSIEQALRILECASIGLHDGAQAKRQHLIISVDGAFAAAWLAPRLGDFLAQCPDVDIEISVAKSLQDVSGKNPVVADLMIVYGRPPWPRYRAERLVSFSEFLVSSPEYASLIKDVNDLNRASLIHEVDHTGWHRWLSYAGGEQVNFRRGPIIHDSISCLIMALNGGGVAIGDNVSCADWLKEGRLVKVLPTSMPLEESFYLLVPEVVAELPAVQQFRGWLLKALRQSVLE